jgi:hypothetical protein
MPYIARNTWLSMSIYSPGVPTGVPDELYGVLAPGAKVDITSVYSGGITAVLGSPAVLEP